MGLLKNFISDAVGEGIGKGIQSAVGKAVEGAVRPAADRLAGRAADQLNQTTNDINQSMQEARAAQGEAAAALHESAQVMGESKAAAGDGFASLGAVLGGFASSMQDAAGQVAQNMKECPQCGEIAPAENKFCPKCGAPLPEHTLAEGFLCPKCGKQNAPGTTFCGACGELLPAAAEERAAQQAKWDALLPQYPRWTLRGTPEVDADDELNGHPLIRVHIAGARHAELTQYVAALQAAGFVPYDDSSSDIYYKVIDGLCRAFDKTDADHGDSLSLRFFVGDYDKRAADRLKQKAEQMRAGTNDAAKIVGDAAKGLFKKLF